LERGQLRDIISPAGIHGIGFRRDSFRSEWVDFDVKDSHRSCEWNEVLLARKRVQCRGGRLLLRNEELYYVRLGPVCSGSFVSQQRVVESTDNCDVGLECLCGSNKVSVAGLAECNIRFDNIR
jgi:hypothetical protein